MLYIFHNSQHYWYGGVNQLIERWASNQKVAKPQVDSRCGSALLCPWERHLMMFPTLRPSSLPVVVAQPDERHANVGVVWQTQSILGSTTSGSNEEYCRSLQNIRQFLIKGIGYLPGFAVIYVVIRPSHIFDLINFLFFYVFWYRIFRSPLNLSKFC